MRQKRLSQKAVLITSEADVRLLDQGVEISGIAGAYGIIQQNEHLDLEYFLDYAEPEFNLQELVGKVANNWYRDQNGVDIFEERDVSVGRILTYKLSIEFSSALRYYFAFRKYTKRYKTILVSSNTSSSLSLSTAYFLDSIEFFNSGNIADEHISPSPDRGKTRNPPIHNFLSAVLRALQWPFIKYIRHKTLVINDWTYKKINNSRCLNMNKFNPFRSFCLRKGLKYIGYTEQIFPYEINNEIVVKNVTKILKEFDIDANTRLDLAMLFSEVFQNEYSESREMLIKTYCAYREMFENYLPSMIVVPGYAHTFYQVVYGIARSKNVPTIYIQDGYAVWLDKYLLPRNKNNKSQMIDCFATMGSLVDSFYRDVFHDDNIKTVNIFPPVLKTHVQTRTNIEGKSVIIMFPYGMVHSPYCRWDQKYKYVLDVVAVLHSLGHSDIKIKMKRSQDPDKEEENCLMSDMLNKRGYSNVEMVFGEFSSYLGDAIFVVGYLGTAIVESVFRDVPFYVYEPPSLGMSDKFINNFTIIDRRQISRNLIDLHSSISQNDSVFLDEGMLYDGVEINQINFVDMSQKLKSRTVNKEVV